MSTIRKKCDELITRYEEFIAKGGPKNITSEEKMTYINEQYNAINLISKLLCISSMGVDPDKATVTQDEFEKTVGLANNLFRDKPAETKTEKTNETEKPPMVGEKPKKTAKKSKGAKKSKPVKRSSKVQKIIDEVEEISKKSTKEIFAEELDALGIPSTSFGYTAVMTMTDIKISKDSTYNDIISAISEKTGKTINVVSSAISSLVKKANFSASKHVPVMAKRVANGETITKQYFIAELQEYCVDE